MAPRGGKHRGGRGQPQTSPRGAGAGGSPYRGGGKGRGNSHMPGSSFVEEELAFTARMMSQDGPQYRGTPRGGRGGGGGGGRGTPQRSGANTPRGRGGMNTPRGRGGANKPRGGRGTPNSTRGAAPRGRGFGIGTSPRGDAKTPNNYYDTSPNGNYKKTNNTLSNLLYASRPLLRPVIFVPSVLTKVLFEEEAGEELLKAAVQPDEDRDTQQNNAPTADKVFRVFSGANFPPPPPSSSGEEEDEREGKEDGIEEVDFNDMGKLLESLVVATHPSSSRVNEKQEVFTGYFTNTNTHAPQNLDNGGGDKETVLEIDFTELDKLTLIEGGAAASDLDVSGREDVLMQQGGIGGASRETLDSMLVSATNMHEVVGQIRREEFPLQDEGVTIKSEGITIEEEENTVFVRNDAVSDLGDQEKGDDGSMCVDESVNAGSLSTRSSGGSTTVSSSTVFSNEHTTAFSSESTRRERSIATVEACVAVEEQLEPVAKPSADEGSVSANVLHAHIVTDTSIKVESTTTETLDVQMTSNSIGTMDVDTGTTPTPPPAEPGQDLFFVDVVPEPVTGTELPAQSQPIPDDDDSDEIIVYVAPHPRVKHTTHTQSEQKAQDEEKERDTSRFEPYVGLSQTTTVNEPSFPLASTSSTTQSQPQTPNKAKNKPTTERLRVPPVTTPRQAKVFKAKERRRLKKRAGGGGFSVYGAMMSEAQPFIGSGKDTKKASRRRGDSDLDWGDTGGDENDAEEEEEFMSFADVQKTDKGKGKQRAEEEEEEGGAEGMEVDELDVGAMKRFVGGLLGKDAGRFVTADDIRDGERMRVEDEDEELRGLGSGSSEDDEEVEEMFNVEEGMLISEAAAAALGEEDDSDEDDSDDEDEERTPRTSFQARLERLRERARGKRPADVSFDDGSDDDEDVLDRNMTWAEEDDDFIEEIQNILDENEDILQGRNRKERRKLFTAIRDGTFDYDDDLEGFSPAKRKKDKRNSLPTALQAQWDKDRQKKAERKEARALERLLQASDPLSQKKGGKKGRKAMKLAAGLDPTINVLPNRIIDMTTLVQQIRRFVADIGGRDSMSLPPTNKETRKNVHELALAFNLKSLSKGKGDSRYITLTKTSRTGWGVDEKKVGKIVRRAAGAGGDRGGGGEFVHGGGRGGGAGKVPKHKEGDEVGKAAPKISEANIGFRMLAMMGWSEGDRIGVSGGLDAPLTAIIKTTKLGLGATK